MNTPDPLPISLVAHTVFCPRRAWLEAAGERTPSIAIEAGQAAHRRVDTRSDPRARRHQSVPVSSTLLGIVGVCDIVVQETGGLDIIEYKSSPLRRKATVTEAQKVQLALQRLCLEEAGHLVLRQSVWFTNHRLVSPLTWRKRISPLRGATSV